MIRDLVQLLDEQKIYVFLALVVILLAVSDPIAVLAMGAGFLVIRRSMRTPSGSERTLLLQACSAFAVVVLVPLALIGFSETMSGFTGLVKEAGAGDRLPLLALYYVALGCAVWGAKNGTHWIGDGAYITIVLLFAVIVRLVYAEQVDIVQASDFARMGELARSFVDNGFSIRSLVPFNSIHFERAVFYLVPFELILPGSERVVYVANISFMVASIGLIYCIARRLFPVGVARVAVVVTCFIPESIILTNVSTHDVPGTFWILANLYVLLRLIDKPLTNRGYALVSILLAVTLVMSEIQRTVGIIMVLFDLLLVSAYCMTLPKKRVLRVSVACIFAVILSVPTTNFVRSLLHDNNSRGSRFEETVLAQSDPSTDGSLAHWKAQWDGRELPPDPLGYAGKRLVGGLLMNPFDYSSMLVRKSERMVMLGSQHRFFLGGATLNKKPLALDERRVIYLVTSSFAAAFWFLLGIGTVVVLRANGLHVAPALLIAVFAVPMILLMELQPRYFHFFWYLGAPYLAVALLWLMGSDDRENGKLRVIAP